VERLLRGFGAEVEPFQPDEAQAAADAGPDRIVVASGDGNVARVADIAGRAGIELAVVPSGTANDFARAMGITSARADACRLAVEGRRTRAVDLAWCGDAPFVNVASLGLSVVALHRAEGLKSLLGPLGYPAASLRAALTSGGIECRVTVDGREVHDGPAWQVLVANSGAFGGGADVDADVDDARLKLVLLERGPRLRLARHAWGLKGGEIEEQPGVKCARGREVVVELPQADAREVNVDGDIEQCGSQVSFRIQGAAFRLVVPDGE
jgi:diacylglycerol kinase family enzyme